PGLADRLWTLWWDRPLDDDPELAWALTVKVAQENDTAWVGVRLALRPLGHQIGRVRFRVVPPPLVGVLVRELDVVEDGWAITSEPAYATDREGVSQLVDLLLDPSRRLPVLVLSAGKVYDPEGDSYRDQPLVDADAVAGALAGLAHVVVLEPTSISFLLTDMVGRDLSVFGGAVRLYWPGLDHRSDPRDHPLWLPARLAEPRNQPVEDMLLRRIGPAATFRLSTAAFEARLRAAAEAHRRAEIAALWERAKDASLAPEWQQELERAWAENERLRRENAELVTQLEVAHDNLRAMTVHGANADQEPGDGGEDDVAVEPRSVGEAVEWAAARCPHLVVLDEARASARRAAYRQPGRAWRALVAMEEVAAAWSDGGLSSSFYEAFAEGGFNFAANVSPTALGKHRQDYERTYEGEKILLGPHLRMGAGSPEACCRIYFYLDEAKRHFVVGHVGNHLSDSTSG
ncbi:MAG: hypothetical protein M3198_13995, partial [Actinomycetota bacterium]|nr:hypothetical protein [Actinomycetota bacterium]